MDFENIHARNSSELQSLYPGNLSRKLILEINSNLANTPDNKLSTSAPNLFAWVTFVGMISWILFEIIKELRTVKVNHRPIILFTPTKCRSCKFYAHNLYLKCAVHPSTVMTRQASNCLDYCGKHNSNSHNNSD